MTVWTIDVSEHDWGRRGGNLDWVAVRQSGIAGMCARATYGDPGGYHFASYHFGDFVRGAKAAGFTLRGGYHNLVRGDQTSINRQVDWLRREMDAHDANWGMLDVERYEELVAAGMVPTWDDVRRFDDRWDAVDQRVLAGYIPPWNWSGHLGRPDLRAFRGPLIPSNYPLGETSDEYRQLYARCGGDSGPGWAPYGNRIPDGWQYSSRGKVPGAAYICDVNAWRMTSDQLTALLIGDDDMQQTEALAYPGNVKGRTVGQALVDVQNLRDWLIGVGAVFPQEPDSYPRPDSPLAVLVEAARRGPVQAAPVDPAVVAAAVKAALSDPDVLAGVAKAVADENARRQQA